VIFVQGQRHRITKDRFVIGRTNKTADLAIDDHNISRRHILIERTDEGHVISDMGSKNGIEFQGKRIERKTLAAGDLFRVAQFVLRFDYE